MINIGMHVMAKQPSLKHNSEKYIFVLISREIIVSLPSASVSLPPTICSYLEQFGYNFFDTKFDECAIDRDIEIFENRILMFDISFDQHIHRILCQKDCNQTSKGAMHRHPP